MVHYNKPAEHMTILEHFAIQCLQGILACDAEFGHADQNKTRTVMRCELAVKHAKELLKVLDEDKHARIKAANEAAAAENGQGETDVVPGVQEPEAQVDGSSH